MAVSESRIDEEEVTTASGTQIRLLTVVETAQILRVSRQRVYELARLGIIPVVRLGRQIRIDEAGLREWIEAGGRALAGGWRRIA